MNDIALLARKAIFEKVAIKVKGKLHVNVDLRNEVVRISIEHRGIYFNYSYTDHVIDMLQTGLLTNVVVKDCLIQYNKLIKSLFFHEDGYVPGWYGKEVE